MIKREKKGMMRGRAKRGNESNEEEKEKWKRGINTEEESKRGGKGRSYNEGEKEMRKWEMRNERRQE